MIRIFFFKADFLKKNEKETDNSLWLNFCNATNPKIMKTYSILIILNQKKKKIETNAYSNLKFYHNLRALIPTK